MRSTICAAASILVVSTPVAAQDDDGSGPRAPADPSPPPGAPPGSPDSTEPSQARLPVLLHLPPAQVPGAEAAWPPDGIVEVVVQVEVAADGTVLAVAHEGPLSDAFRVPALDMARSARFEPARDDTGTAVDARIALRVRLDRDATPPPSISGTVGVAGSAERLSGLLVELTDDTGQVRVASTAADGTFAFVGLPAGTWTLRAGGSGLRPETVAVTTRAGAVQEVDLRLVRDAALTADAVGAELIVQRRPSATVVTERVLDTDLAMVLPGTNGDVVKVVQSLPGVARSPLGTGSLIIRGTAPEDSVGFVDGMPLPMVFHFGGLSTVIHGRSVAEVGYVPGNAGVRYGRFLGGLVDIHTRDTRPEHPVRAVHVDLYQAGLFLDTPVGDRSALTVSGRRSYIDTLLQGALDARGIPVQAPVYSDVQARWLRIADSGTRTELLFLRSHDTFEYLGVEEGEEVPAVALDLAFWRLRGRLQQSVGGVQHELVVGVGVDTESFSSFSYDGAHEQVASVTVRDEWLREPTPEALGWRVGLDLWSGRDVFLYDIEQYGPFEGGATPFHAPAAYGEVTVRRGPLTATPGLRGDLVVYPYDAISGSLDPRLHTRWTLDDVWALTAATGSYSRLPTARQMVASSDGNPTLLAERSWQNALGVEVSPRQGLRVEVTGFANRLDRRIVGREDRFRFQATPLLQSGPVDDGPYANDGTGTILGGELFARVDQPRFTGWLSGTVSRSRRVDRGDLEPTLFTYDQPVVLTALGTWLLPRNWRLGSRVRFTSGNPYTPVVQRFQDMESRSFVPIYGPEDSARLAPFTALDLRVDKTFTFQHWRLTTSLDLQNLTFRKNPELPAWNSTYTTFDPITGLPPLPVFGLEGEW